LGYAAGSPYLPQLLSHWAAEPNKLPLYPWKSHLAFLEICKWLSGIRSEPLSNNTPVVDVTDESGRPLEVEPVVFWDRRPIFGSALIGHFEVLAWLDALTLQAFKDAFESIAAADVVRGRVLVLLEDLRCCTRSVFLGYWTIDFGSPSGQALTIIDQVLAACVWDTAGDGQTGTEKLYYRPDNNVVTKCADQNNKEDEEEMNPIDQKDGHSTLCVIRILAGLFRKFLPKRACTFGALRKMYEDVFGRELDAASYVHVFAWATGRLRLYQVLTAGSENEILAALKDLIEESEWLMEAFMPLLDHEVTEISLVSRALQEGSARLEKNSYTDKIMYRCMRTATLRWDDGLLLPHPLTRAWFESLEREVQA